MEPMIIEPINIKQKFDSINELWSPKIIAQLNDYHIKIAKVMGEFIWHRHNETDEAFIVIEGELDIHLRDRVIKLGSGDLYVVPKFTEHKPIAEKECKILLIEPAGTVNTGDYMGDWTKEKDDWI
jgi:mannose-6-phosphate isomerase-like protein (cupin superfamily)